jgi:hypothetical protein
MFLVGLAVIVAVSAVAVGYVRHRVSAKGA